MYTMWGLGDKIINVLHPREAECSWANATEEWISEASKCKYDFLFCLHTNKFFQSMLFILSPL